MSRLVLRSDLCQAREVGGDLLREPPVPVPAHKPPDTRNPRASPTELTHPEGKPLRGIFLGSPQQPAEPWKASYQPPPHRLLATPREPPAQTTPTDRHCHEEVTPTEKNSFA